MSTYSGGSAGFWPPFPKPERKTPDSPVVWDTETGIEELRSTGWCGTIPYELAFTHGAEMPELTNGRLRFGTHKDFIEWQEGGAK